MSVHGGNDDNSNDEDDENTILKAYYALLADLSPEDWEDGAAYSLSPAPRANTSDRT